MKTPSMLLALWGESISHCSRHKGSIIRKFDAFFGVSQNKLLKNLVRGDLRHHPAHVTSLCRRQYIRLQFPTNQKSWWRHQMETFSALLAICAGNSPVSGEFPGGTKASDAELWCFFLCARLSKHSRGWWFETLSHPLWRHRNVQYFPILNTHHTLLISQGIFWNAFSWMKM